MTATYSEMDRITSMANRCSQHGLKADGNAIVRDIVDELNRSGARLPESTRNALRSAAARVLVLLWEQQKLNRGGDCVRMNGSSGKALET